MVPCFPVSRRRLLGGAAAVAGGLAWPAMSQPAFRPTRAVKLISPLLAGGTIIGTQAVAQAAPDGHTFGVALSALTINPSMRRCTLTPPDGAAISFTLPSFRRDMLVKGSDDLKVTLARESQISAYETLARQQRPWEWPDRAAKR